MTVGLEVRRVLLHEPVDRRTHRVDDSGRGGGVDERDEARQPLRVDGVVGGGGPHLSEPRGLGRAREREDVVAVVEAQHHTPLAPQHPAQHGGDLTGHAPPGLDVGHRHDRSAEYPAAPRRLPKPALGSRHQVDGGEVRLLERRAPRAEPVLLEDDRPRLRLRADRRPDLLRQPEPGPPVGHPHRLLAEQVLDDVAAALGVCQTDDRIRMGVDHGLRVEKPVQQGLD